MTIHNCSSQAESEHAIASIHKDVALNAPAARVWAAVRDFGALHTRLVWIVDVLPHAIAGYIAAQMDEAAKAMQRAFPGRGA